MEESAISSKRGLNDDFVEQFSALNIELTTSDIDGWFHADGPGYEYLDEQEIVYLVSVAEGNECDEEKNANENTQHSTQKAQMQRRSSRPPNPPIGGPRPTLGAQVSLKLLFGYVTIFSSADLFTTDLNCRKKLACDIISEC